jgi:phosphoglycolate phosphatase
MIKLIIFDFDGVIEDNYELHYQMSTRKTTGLTREEHRKLFEGNIHIEREKFKDRDTGFDLIKHFNEEKNTQIINEQTKKVLIELSKKYKMGIVTSAIEQPINNYLANNKISNVFSFVYGLETNKIKVHKLIKALTEFNIKKEECLFVTDTLGDIKEANEAEIRTIAIDFGYHERERLEKGNPFMIISSLGELLNIENNI